ncbi:MAG TPA: response regulator transcription factor [Candidatus Dormibacteraeota bacterium]|jgi:NarL family two-component system response regulator LiaR|nr:response regulator transcription factor [Candidatus Dormibacteraeota bacterium]
MADRPTTPGVAGAIRVVLVDDHAVVRQGLRAFLRLQPDIAIAGEADGGPAAVEVVTREHPDVVLMDLVMPAGDGVGAIRRLREIAPATRVLVLSSYVDDAQVFAAIDAGAAGYMLKDVEPEALAEAIREVHRGRPALHPDVASRLMHRASAPPGSALTARERDVLRLIAEGFANKEIGRRLFISEKTVKTHVSNILQKLDVADRTQAALAAVRGRLVD